MERTILTLGLSFTLTLGLLTFFISFFPGKFSDKPILSSESSTPTLSEIVETFSPPSPQPETTPMQTFSGEIIKETESEHGIKIPLLPYQPLPLKNEYVFKSHFPVSTEIRPAVEFWRNVYGTFKQEQSMVHDSLHLDVIYGSLDFSRFFGKNGSDDPTKMAIRNEIETEKKEQLKELLYHFDVGGLPRTDGEQIIYGLFENISEPQKFRKAADRIRMQWGLKDRFELGMVRSGRYMPLIEEIFIQEGVPQEISRLTFVESMFSLDALSKVGAAGPWQFMPQTAKAFMKVNTIVDERRDPIIAARGAARLLKKNYTLLKSWPLAINSYNTGTGRLVRAMRQLGTKDIGVIIKRFKDPGYQFASRNFYPEFVAALEVYNNHPLYFGTLQREEPIPFDTITLPAAASLSRLAEATATDIGILKDLNPFIFPEKFEENTLYPQGYPLRVPYEQKQTFLAAFESFKEEEQWSLHLHLAHKGEKLEDVAKIYGVTPEGLREINGLTSNRLKEGQLLKIPSPQEKAMLGGQ